MSVRANESGGHGAQHSNQIAAAEGVCAHSPLACQSLLVSRRGKLAGPSPFSITSVTPPALSLAAIACVVGLVDRW